MTRMIFALALMVMAARAQATSITGNTVITVNLLGYVLRNMSVTVFFDTPVPVTPEAGTTWNTSSVKNITATLFIASATTGTTLYIPADAVWACMYRSFDTDADEGWICVSTESMQHAENDIGAETGFAVFVSGTPPVRYPITNEQIFWRELNLDDAMTLYVMPANGDDLECHLVYGTRN